MTYMLCGVVDQTLRNSRAEQQRYESARCVSRLRQNLNRALPRNHTEMPLVERGHTSSVSLRTGDRRGAGKTKGHLRISRHAFENAWKAGISAMNSVLALNEILDKNCQCALTKTLFQVITDFSKDARRNDQRASLGLQGAYHAGLM